MRRGLLAALAAIWIVTGAAAETRIFIVDAASDGYGVDQCLASGARCGVLVANAYCQSKAFAEAASFRRIGRTEITATAAEPLPRGGEHLVAIECAR